MMRMVCDEHAEVLDWAKCNLAEMDGSSFGSGILPKIFKLSPQSTHNAMREEIEWLGIVLWPDEIRLEDLHLGYFCQFSVFGCPIKSEYSFTCIVLPCIPICLSPQKRKCLIFHRESTPCGAESKVDLLRWRSIIVTSLHLLLPAVHERTLV